MKMKWLILCATFSLLTTNVMADVSPEQITKLLVHPGTSWVGERDGNASHKVTLLANGHGLSVHYGTNTIYACGKAKNISRAGGKGTATMNCQINNYQNKNDAVAWAPKHPAEIRFEWKSLNEVYYQEWPNMAAKAGQYKNKPPHHTAVLKKQ